MAVWYFVAADNLVAAAVAAIDHILFVAVAETHSGSQYVEVGILLVVNMHC